MKNTMMILLSLMNVMCVTNSFEHCVNFTNIFFFSIFFVILFFQGRTECVCDEEEGFIFWNETQKCYRVYTQGPCPNNAWLIPADDLTEVFCECQPGYHFSPSQYACRRSPIVKPLGGNPGLHLLLKNHKLLTSHTSESEYDQVSLGRENFLPLFSLKLTLSNPKI